MLSIYFTTLFPEMVLPALGHSILKRAQEKGLVTFSATNPRDFTHDKHRTVDDEPYGGGPGMVMKPEPIYEALKSLNLPQSAEIILTDPLGEPFTQNAAHDLAQREHLVFVCGHYEGIDHRIRTKLCTRSYSVGDYVLTGGELPALVMTDAIVRLIPGALGSAESLEEDSHVSGLLSYPQYTRPQEFLGEEVPEVLRTGDHKAIARWRRRQALQMTRQMRPDLFCKAKIQKEDLDLL